MTEDLKIAVSRDKRGEQKISPICENDAEIIWELQIALGKTKADSLKRIVEQWKVISDIEVRDMLLEWNINNQEKEEEIKKRGRLVKFENRLIDVYSVKTVTKRKNYDYVLKNMIYTIIINKDFSEQAVLSDTVFKYNSKEDRNLQFDKLVETLNKYININIVE